MNKILSILFVLTLSMGTWGCSDKETIILAPKSGIINGGFEFGDLTGWVTDGEPQVRRRLDTIRPIEGSYMCFLSTGIASDTVPYSLISQTIAIGSQHTFLTIKWNMIFEQFISQIHQPNTDFFRVRIISDQGVSQMLFLYNAATAAFQNNALVNPPGDMLPIPGGPFEEAFMTGWKSFQYNIAAHRNSNVTLIIETVGQTAGNQRIMAIIDSIILI